MDHSRCVRSMESISTEVGCTVLEEAWERWKGGLAGRWMLATHRPSAMF